MRNFQYGTPTRLIFGKNAIENLPEVLRSLGKKVLLVYGGGSIKKIGLYQKVMELLKDFQVTELSGVQPNPKYESVLAGVKICKEQSIDVVLAVGGGSVIDCSKAVAAGAKYDGDVWDFLAHKAQCKAALPIVDVLTLAATGSEFDAACVISKTETNEKTGFFSKSIFPKVSILDPEYTFSVSPLQTAAGAADGMSHVMEQYFTEESSLLTDGLCEATIRALMANAKVAVKEPENYEARAELMLACSFGCNGILSLGNSRSGWPCHALEHALSAYYDIAHGVGLAIVPPHWMQLVLKKHPEKAMPLFAKYGVNVFGLDSAMDKKQLAEKAIEATAAFYKEIGLPCTLKEAGIDNSRIDEMARHIADNEGLDKAYMALDLADIKEILTASL